MDHIPAVFSGSNLVKRLLNITRWLRKALVLLPDPQISKRCNVKDVENFLEESQVCSFILDCYEYLECLIDNSHFT